MLSSATFTYLRAFAMERPDTNLLVQKIPPWEVEDAMKLVEIIQEGKVQITRQTLDRMNREAKKNEVSG